MPSPLEMDPRSIPAVVGAQPWAAKPHSSEDKLFGSSFCLTHFKDDFDSFSDIKKSFALYGDPPSGTSRIVCSRISTGVSNLQRNASGGQLLLQPASELGRGRHYG